MTISMKVSNSATSPFLFDFVEQPMNRFTDINAQATDSFPKYSDVGQPVNSFTDVNVQATGNFPKYRDVEQPMNRFTDIDAQATDSYPKYSDVICLSFTDITGIAKCEHFIIDHPGTDLFIETLRTFQAFFRTLPFRRQLLLCRCIVDGLASNSVKPVNFFCLTYSNSQWRSVSSEEATETTYLTLKHGLSHPKSLRLENQMKHVVIRGIGPAPKEHQIPVLSTRVSSHCDYNLQLKQKNHCILNEKCDTKFLSQGFKQEGKAEMGYRKDFAENDDFIQRIEAFFLDAKLSNEESFDPTPIK